MTKGRRKRRSAKVTRKPSGTAGPFRVTRTADGITSGQFKIEWPPEQKKIERKIVGYFVREFEKTGAKFLNIEDGGTEELDFLLTVPGGKMYLELMEAVLPAEGQKPHQTGSQCHRPISYANKIWGEVDKKVTKYGLKHSIPIDLLIYTTHEQYAPNEAAIQVLRRYFLDRQHPFHYVFFIVPLAEELSPMWVLFNRDHPLEPPPVEEMAERWWINVPSSGFTARTNFGQATIDNESGLRDVSMTIKSFPRGSVSQDGLTVSVEAELQDGSLRTLVFPYDQLDFLVQALMSFATAAFNQQVGTGRVSAVNPVGAAMVAEGFRVLPNNPQQHALVQITGRSDPNGPLGLGSFAVDARLAQGLGKRLLAVAEGLGKSEPNHMSG